MIFITIPGVLECSMVPHHVQEISPFMDVQSHLAPRFRTSLRMPAVLLAGPSDVFPLVFLPF